MSDTTNDTQPSDRQDRQNKMRTTDGVTFEAIERDGLGTVPVFSQVFDNQWFPRDLLDKAFKAGMVSDELERRRAEIVRNEYVRSLINGSQIVINRAFIYNNPAIYQDYMPTHSLDLDKQRIAHNNREAFRQLLQEHTIIPYLYDKQSPVVPPKFETLAFAEWKKMCLREATGMQCIRLSWDDAENKEKIEQLLGGRFEEYALAIGTKRYKLDKRIADLGLQDSDQKALQEALQKRFQSVMRKSYDLLVEKGEVSREELYKEFVTVDGSKPADRKYDKGKLFAREIKQLLDLVYSRNLPDALDGYLLTPMNSLPRTALQELFDNGQGDKSFLETLQTMLQRPVFSLVQEGLCLPSLDILSLQDVYEIRKTDTWYSYIDSLKKLLDEPLTFAEGGAQAVHENYYRLATFMKEKIRSRYKQDISEYTKFVIELFVEVGDAWLSVIGTGDPHTLFISTSGPLIRLVGNTAPFTIRFIIRDIQRRHAEKGLSHSIDLMKGKVKNAEEQWNTLLRYVTEKLGKKEGQISEQNCPVVTPPGN